MKLVIVESPTKAKTISKFLGKSFTVKSSYGHVRDLPKKEMGIDIENNFEPKYVIPDAARTRVAELKKIAARADEVILATDEDREGEAISWHLMSALKLEKSSPKRIVFHEITKTAIEKALQNPREIDLNLVDAQQARRVLDRLVGYELSPFLWKKIRRGLSAGRVQSVALRLIAEREREIEKFKSEAFWTVPLELKKKNNSENDKFQGELVEKNGEKIEQTATLKLFAGDYKTKKTILKNEKEAALIVKDLKNSEISVTDIQEKETLRSPAPPFTTSTLQQTAINTLGWSAKSTMMTAQKLYEQGFITYMRTDSVNLSMESMLAAKKIITKKFGKDYALENPRFFKNKSKGAQEAHEAIRPASVEKIPEDLKEKLETSQYKLYKLIWERMAASQMQPAVFDSVKVSIEAQNKKTGNRYALRASGSTIKFDGYLKAYSSRKNLEENMLPLLKTGEKLEIAQIETQEKSTPPPPRYTEASLVKVLEENGIGRPSTYAPTISTIIERKYVDKNEEKKLYPLEIGLVVNDLLVEHFPQIVDTGFTATLEEDFDQIAEGKKEWVPIIKNFYGPFHKNIESKVKTVKKEDFQEKLDRSCPECGGDLVVKFGRFGKFIACSNYPNCRYTEKTDSEKKLDEENAGNVCDKCGAPMVVKRGRFGAFLGCSKYPDCKNIQKIENKTGITCPQCQKGAIVEKKSKKGRTFYACNGYPDCKFALWNKPTGEKCPQCGSLMTYAAKEKTKCSSKECGYER
ncbi:MAG: DNA topoisomerase I [Candidatus Moranbacteria bacterium RIFOXYA12_FULL_44_15]|nr:MAG: DNA topoisomerase I [Candidatus Moranbacteria bacterium RIFOXYA12_FULL_44_15]OGI34903.1 MAG: DNA topoisomerase I [Candidatus Moranbacteria bacterium RIFOXYA2_FULL_43_15]